MAVAEKQIQGVYKVVGLSKPCAAYFHLVLEAPGLAEAASPGQFVHIKVSDGLEPLFRRPFSIFRAGGGRVEILFEAVGRGSRLLTARKKGDSLDVLGPLGTPFAMPDARVGQIVFVGGGIGIAPLMFLADKLKGHRAHKTLLCGARTQAHVIPMAAFRRNGVKAYVATDDGSAGVKGRVPELFKEIAPDVPTMVYTCGPRPMMAAVQDFAREHGLAGQASCEEVMACGLGACLGCSIMTSKGYRTVCHDGPVFDLKELVFS